MTSKKLAHSAIYYASIGWHIFPLRPRTKEPFAELGVYNATNNVDQIIDWWARWPFANIGLHCGGSGLLGLDLDAYKDTFNGSGFLARSDEETITNLTGSGGTHLIYAMPEATRYSNATGTLPPGIDVRGWGGYLVIPPSVHPNGTPYRWEVGYGPQEVAPLMLPYSLRSILDTAKAHHRISGPSNIEAVQLAQVIVENIMTELDISAINTSAYDGDGRRWILTHCPFNPVENPHVNDRSAFIIIARDGHISAGCHHQRCRERLQEAKLSGWRWILAQRDGSHVTP